MSDQFIFSDVEPLLKKFETDVLVRWRSRSLSADCDCLMTTTLFPAVTPDAPRETEDESLEDLLADAA